MLIFGSKTESTPIEAGKFYCPNCQHECAYRRTSNRSWFTLFFVPIIPLGQNRDLAECQNCLQQFLGSSITEPVAQSPTSSDEPVLMAEIEPDSANRLSAPANSGVGRVNVPIHPTTSAAAIASLALSLVSPVFLLACGLSVFTSVFAIFFGHVSLSRIARSSGRLHGRWMAITGLVIGYPILLLSMAVFGLFVSGLIQGVRDRPLAGPGLGSGVITNDPSSRLREAEMSIMTPTPDGSGYGNSAQAKQLATEFASRIELARELLIEEESRKSFSLSKGKFIVHCELHPDKCAFVVHVPSYRKFEDDAKVVIEESAWAIAEDLCSEVSQPGDSLAVGLRGAFLYGAVMIGTMDENGQAIEESSKSEREALESFFKLPEPELAMDEEHLEPNPLQIRTDSASQDAEFGPNASPDTEPEIDQSPSEVDQMLQELEAPALDRPNSTDLEANEQQTVSEDGSGNPSVSVALSQRDPPASRPDQVIGSERTEGNRNVNADLIFQSPPLDWEVTTVAFAQDDRSVICAEQGGRIHCYDLANGKELGAPLALDSIPTTKYLALSKDSSILFVAGSSNQILSLALTPTGVGGQPKSMVGHRGEVTAMVASTRAPFIISGDDDGKLIWQAYNGQSSRSLPAHDYPILAVHAPPDGIVGQSTDGTEVVQFNLKTGAKLGQFALTQDAYVGAAFSPNGASVAMIAGREVLVSDTGLAIQRTESNWSSSDMLDQVAFHPRQNWIIAGAPKSVTVHDSKSGAVVSSYRVDKGEIKHFDISDDGTNLVLVHRDSASVLKMIGLPTTPNKQ